MMTGRSVHHAALDLEAQAVARLPELTRIEQVELILCEDHRTVVVHAYYGGDEYLNTEFELPVEARGQPFHARTWERILLSSFRGTLH